jgi:hypothetical protein
LGFDAVKQVGVVDIPRGEIGERAAPLVLKLDQRRASWDDGHRLVAATERLQLRFLIGEMTYSSGRSRLPSNIRA